MIQFAPVLPPSLYSMLDTGTYHLVQAHHVTNAERSVAMWLDRDSQDPNHVVILDNGMIELGSPDIDALRIAADMIKPDIVICPDMLRDKVATMDLFTQYVETCESLAPAVMVVPQGSSVWQWCQCASLMIDILYRQTHTHFVVGVPKVLDTFFEGGRYEAISWLLKSYPQIKYGYRIHLLGMWYGIGDVKAICRDFSDAIIGVDSTLPFAHALANTTTGEDAPKCGLDDNDFVNPSTEISVLWQATLNIAVVRNYLEQNAVSAH